MSYPVTPTLSVEAFQVSRIWPDAGWVNARFVGADGAVVSPPVGPYTSSSEICPAGQAVLAVMFTRTYRVVAWLNVIETVLPLAGSNTRAADGDRSLNEDPVVLPCTLR